MAKEAIQAVLQAEEQAAEILRQAREQARSLEGQLAEQGLEEEARLRKEAGEKEAAFRKKIETEAKQAVEKDLAEADREAAAWTSCTDRDLQKAVDRIKEEVMHYGDR